MKSPIRAANTQLSKMKQTRSMTLMIISIASVIVVFCLVASRTLLSEAAHQRRVVNGRNQAIAQLKANINDLNTLSGQYQAFDTQSTNIIGGNAKGTGPNDGTNSQIVLDALPSQYDFPGLTASVEKILSDRSIKPDSIGGADDESANIATAIPNPQPVKMTFSFSATSNYKAIAKLYSDFQRSIRPFHVVTIQLVGTDSQLSVSSTINTYYQPAKSLSVKAKAVQ